MRKKFKSKLLRACAYLSVAISAQGCGHLRFPAAFKIDVAQGNIVELEKVKQLQPGMTQRQVVYLLGSPVMRSALQQDTWRYTYQFSEGGEPPKRYNITLKFDGEILQDVKGDTSKIKEWHK